MGEARSRIATGNRSYFSFLWILKSRVVSRESKARTYISVVLYEEETWTLTLEGTEGLRRWETKVLRRIYGRLWEGGVWRKRRNRGLENLFWRPNLVAEIPRARLRWLDNLERIPHEGVVSRIYRRNPGRLLRDVRSKDGMMGMQEHLRRMGVRRCRILAQDRQLRMETMMQAQQEL